MKYYIELYNVKDGEYGDYYRWCSFDLITEGNTLEELLDNAIYFLIAQDGEDVGERVADDKLAYDLITKEYERLVRREIQQIFDSELNT